MANDDCSQQSEKIVSLEKDVEAMSTKMPEKGACSVSPRIDAIETRLSNQATRLAVLKGSIESANNSLVGVQKSLKDMESMLSDNISQLHAKQNKLFTTQAENRAISQRVENWFKKTSYE